MPAALDFDDEPSLGAPASDEGYTFEVAPERSGDRLDRFLAAEALAAGLALSRTRLKTLIETGFVALNGYIQLRWT